MTCASAALLIFPHIARIHARDDVIRATAFPAAGAAFRLFDGIQTVATGALRGAGDTRTPAFCNRLLIIGLPLATGSASF
jgi:MATE family multidrug resistance protein